MRTAAHGRWAWPGLCAGLALLAAAGWLQADLAARAWAWLPAQAFSQPWRWWLAAGLHFSPMHLLANGGGLALLAVLGRRAGCGTRDALAWALAWPLTHLGLLLQPALQHYGGLSGVLHAGVAVACVALWRDRQRARRRVGMLLLAGLLAKVLLEAPWQGVRQPEGWDIAVAPLAHATGAAAGLACALLLAWWPPPPTLRAGRSAAPERTQPTE